MSKQEILLATKRFINSRNKMAKYTTNKQFEVLVDFMCDNKDFACARLAGNDAKQRTMDLWKEVTTLLNSEGPPVKNPDAWKKVWTDYKHGIRTKLRRIRESRNKTGGGKGFAPCLTINEERVAELLNLFEGINGLPTTVSFGARTKENSKTGNPSTEEITTEIENNTDIDNLLQEIFDEPTTQRPISAPSSSLEAATSGSLSNQREQVASIACQRERVISTPRSKRVSRAQKENLLEKQINIQEKFYENVVHLLKEKNDLLRERNKLEDAKEKNQREELELKRMKINLKEKKLKLLQLTEKSAKKT